LANITFASLASLMLPPYLQTTAELRKSIILPHHPPEKPCPNRKRNNQPRTTIIINWTYRHPPHLSYPLPRWRIGSGSRCCMPSSWRKWNCIFHFYFRYDPIGVPIFPFHDRSIVRSKSRTEIPYDLVPLISS
jgi:hypothetical protein